MATAIATVNGTGLRPGVSKNRRYYPPELIARAVDRAQARLGDPAGRPITMRVAHPDPETAAWAPVTEICGAVETMRVDGDGSMKFGGRLSGNTAGRDVLALVDTRAGRPFLRNVSIRGRWIGDVRTVNVDGVPCETADDLEIDGIDFTHLPGVDGAQIDKVAGPGGALEAAGASRTFVHESCEEALVTATQETTSAPPPPKEPAAPTVYADLGYLSDGQKRLPLTTLAEARAAWAELSESATAEKYTAAQLKRVRSRAAKALRGFGIEVRRDVLGESGGPVLVQRGQVTEGMYGYGELSQSSRPGAFYVRLDNGAVEVTVSSCQIDPHDLSRIGTAAMGGAVKALLAMDPDDDGDIDVPGAPMQDTDHGMDGGESATEARTPPAFLKNAKTKASHQGGSADDESDEESMAGSSSKVDDECEESAAPEQTPASTEDAAKPTQESEVPAMAENPSTPASAAPAATEGGTITLTQESLTQLVASAAGSVVEAMEARKAARKAAKLAAAPAVAEAAPAAETPAATPAAPAAAPAAAAPAVAEGAPATPAVVETEDQRIARLVDERVTAVLQTAVARGGTPISRKGIVGKVNESGTLTPLGSGDAELNEHGLPKSWAGESAPHELKGAARTHLSATLMQHVVGNRI